VTASRYPCPTCGRLIASTGPVYGLPDERTRYVYLRPHSNDFGRPCPGRSCTIKLARVPATSPEPEARPRPRLAAPSDLPPGSGAAVGAADIHPEKTTAPGYHPGAAEGAAATARKQA
jgi:hypothetical protein